MTLRVILLGHEVGRLELLLPDSGDAVSALAPAKPLGDRVARAVVNWWMDRR